MSKFGGEDWIQFAEKAVRVAKFTADVAEAVGLDEETIVIGAKKAFTLVVEDVASIPLSAGSIVVIGTICAAGVGMYGTKKVMENLGYKVSTLKNLALAVAGGAVVGGAWGLAVKWLFPAAGPLAIPIAIGVGCAAGFAGVSILWNENSNELDNIHFCDPKNSSMSVEKNIKHMEDIIEKLKEEIKDKDKEISKTKKDQEDMLKKMDKVLDKLDLLLNELRR